MLNLENPSMLLACCPILYRSVLKMLNRFGRTEGAAYVTTEPVALRAQVRHVNGSACLSIENAPIPSALEREGDRFALLVPYRV